MPSPIPSSSPAPSAKKNVLKLRQAQLWQRGGDYFRIVRLERLEVEYIHTVSLSGRKGTRHVVSKKEFCRLLKHATLLPSAVVATAQSS